MIETRVGDPISEFQDGLYFNKCFPALFSNGKGDFAQARPVKVNFREWLEHKIRFVNPMFTANPHFVLVCHNIMTRHEAITKVRTMVAGNRIHASLLNAIDDVYPQDFVCVRPVTDEVVGSADLTQTTCSQDQKKRVKKVLKAVYVVQQHTEGSRGYKHRGKRQVNTMIRENDGANWFHTVSSAEIHWPEVQRLIRQRKHISKYFERPQNYQELVTYPYKQRIRNVAEFPLEVVIAFRYSNIDSF
ncbi:MAG: hypothetical protein RLZZ86_2624 [Cyanobacteriota bacterium]